METILFSLQKILQKYIRFVEIELNSSKQVDLPQTAIRSGSWMNRNIITAYTSVFTAGDLTGDSIDFMIQLLILETDVKFVVDVSRSNGQIIVDVINEVIKYGTEDELLTQVEDRCIRASKELSAQINNLDSWLR